MAQLIDGNLRRRETFNLCRNLRARDVLFAECIRTFDSMTIDGRSWLYRLENQSSTQLLSQHTLQTYVPPSRRPHIRPANAKPVDMDIYGFRPLTFPWKLLSPYEFLMRWRGEALLAPTEYYNRDIPAKTKWTQAGFALVKSTAYKEGKLVAKPGIHYVVVEPEDSSYSTFPEEPKSTFEAFRHTWILVRKKRPDIVVIEGMKLPSPSRSAQDNAKYCSLFFRPWTNLIGTVVVPNIALLGCNRGALQTIYSHQADQVEEPTSATPRRKKIADPSHTVPNCVNDQIHWAKTWDEYVRGHVATETAAHLIQSFLLKTVAASGEKGEGDEDSEADKSEDNSDIPRLRLSPVDLAALLAPLEEKDEAVDVDKKRKRKTGPSKWCLRGEYGKSMSIGTSVWSTPANDVAAVDRRDPGNMFQREYKEHCAAKRVKDIRVVGAWLFFGAFALCAGLINNYGCFLEHSHYAQ